MIKKLRIKLILLTMISVILVLGVMMSGIIISNYASTTRDVDMILDRLIENGGNFDPDKAPFPEGETEDEIHNRFPRSMGRETFYETRFFYVEFRQNDTTVVNVANVSIDEEEALNLANKVNNKERGYLDNYRYRVVNTFDKKIIYFIDAETRLEQLSTFRNLSLLISFLVILLIFTVIFLLSKKIVKPISDAYERQKRFITNAAHELKTPLTIISANNEMIEISGGESELTDGINRQIIRMNNMVKNLSTLSKIDEEFNVKRLSFDLVETLDDVIEQFKESFEASKKTINKYYENEYKYSGDEGLFRQLFNILLDNALKYSKSKLDVKITTSGKKIIISFINDASKIDIGNLDKCFERFYRFDETRASSIDGSGIGLSIAKEIVTLHNGDIHAIGHENNIFEIKIIL